MESPPKKQRHESLERNPKDPTPEDIWGTDTQIGMAEEIRMQRPPLHDGQNPHSGISIVRVLFERRNKVDE